MLFIVKHFSRVPQHFCERAEHFVVFASDPGDCTVYNYLPQGRLCICTGATGFLQLDMCTGAIEYVELRMYLHQIVAQSLAGYRDRESATKITFGRTLLSAITNFPAKSLLITHALSKKILYQL